MCTLSSKPTRVDEKVIRVDAEIVIVDEEAAEKKELLAAIMNSDAYNSAR